MLCDVMIGKWVKPRPSFEPEVEAIVARKQDSADKTQEIINTVGEQRWEQIIQELKRWDTPRVSGLPHLLSDSLPLDRLEEFKAQVRQAQKFFLTTEFATASLEKMATKETVLKAKEWFRLIHDPMWLEWQIRGAEGLRMGALLYSVPVADGDPAIMCFSVSGVANGSLQGYNVNLCRIYPDSIKATDLGFDLHVEDDLGNPLTNEAYGKIGIMAYDFIVRINSPRITEFRPCDDLTRINRKRARQGRPPLSSYQVVDLNRDVKASLRLNDQEEGGVRFHWRRGHFKARKSGLFWWKPHTAGRREFGEIRKEYVA